MRFRLGSLTKQFTAALILKLAEEGKLTLDDTLHQWLPGLGVPYDTQITIRMLLNHTSGVADYATANFWNNLVFPNPYRPGNLPNWSSSPCSRPPSSRAPFTNIAIQAIFWPA